MHLQTVCKHYTGNKRSRSFRQELHALHSIRVAGGHGCWPILVGSAEGQRAVLTQPLVEPLGNPLLGIGLGVGSPLGDDTLPHVLTLTVVCPLSTQVI